MKHSPLKHNELNSIKSFGYSVIDYPCKNCGETDYQWLFVDARKYKNHKPYYCYCDFCGTMGPRKVHSKDAIEAWELINR